MRASSPLLRPLAASDLGAAVALLARAFRDNPLNRAVIGGDAARRERSNAAGLRVQLPGAHRRGLVLAAHVGGRLVGVLVAEPPFARPPAPAPLGARLRSWWEQGLGVAHRWSEVYQQLLASEPPQPFWYLGLLGVEPEQQRRGVGAALLARFLEEVDAGGERCVLETDRPENLAFYARAGFETVRELTVMAVPVWVLERPARSTGGAP